MLQSLRSSLPQEQLNRLDRVVIFKPTNANGGVPAGCIKAVGSTSQVGVNGSCNTYAGATLRAAIPTDLGAADDYWAPTSRNDRLSQTRPTTSGCGSAPPTAARPARSSMT